MSKKQPWTAIGISRVCKFSFSSNFTLSGRGLRYKFDINLTWLKKKMLWQNNRFTFIISPGETSFHHLGQIRLSRCRRMLITCTLYFFIVLLYTGSKFCLLSSNFTAEECSLLGWICVWYSKLRTKKQNFKKMTNNSLKETHPFELNFSFIYDYPNKYIQIERKKKWTLFQSFPCICTLYQDNRFSWCM